MVHCERHEEQEGQIDGAPRRQWVERGEQEAALLQQRAAASACCRCVQVVDIVMLIVIKSVILQRLVASHVELGVGAGQLVTQQHYDRPH